MDNHEDDKAERTRLTVKFYRLCSTNFEYFCNRALKIRNKNGDLVPLKLNNTQVLVFKLLESQNDALTFIRALILKGRQQGVSTVIAAYYVWKIIHGNGLKAYILTHLAESTQALFGMVKRYYDNLPLYKPELTKCNNNEIYFGDIDCGYKVGTAGSYGVGRGETLQLFHGCLGVETPIYYASGEIKRLDQVKEGDILLTHTMKEGRVSMISTQTKQTLSIKLKGLRHFPITATPEHKFFTKDGWKELKDIEAGECLGFPVLKISNKIRSVPFKQPYIPRPQGGGTRECVQERVELDYNFGRIVGLYLAEGIIKKQSGSRKEPCAVVFVVHEDEVERTKEWLEPQTNLFKSYKIYRRKGTKTVVVSVYGKSFAMFMESFVGKKDTKRFPQGWDKMGKAFVKGLVHGYISGDGHVSPKRDRRISVSSIRIATIIGLRSAVASLGFGWASVGYKSAAVRHGRNEQEAWIFRLTGSGVDRLAKELGKSSMPRKRKDNGNYGTIEISAGYAWVPLVSKVDNGINPVIDLEIDNKDHSYCTIHAATHNSECAYWPNSEEHFAGVMQAVPSAKGTSIVLESTANQTGNVFYRMCSEAVKESSQWQLIFAPWFNEREYTLNPPPNFSRTKEEEELKGNHGLDDSQLFWRRRKIEELGDPRKFKQEYPCTINEAFIVDTPKSFIMAHEIDKANTEGNPIVADKMAPLVIGIDPSGGGKDASAWAVRCGRILRECKEFPRMVDTMELIGHISRIINRYEPERVFIDVGGLGAPIYDRLRELGYSQVHSVNFQERPDDPGKYANKRAEMYDRIKQWLNDPPSQIPDSDALRMELGLTEWGTNSSGKLLLAPKKDLIKSPNLADAFALTFASNVPSRYLQERMHLNREAQVEWDPFSLDDKYR